MSVGTRAGRPEAPVRRADAVPKSAMEPVGPNEGHAGGEDDER